MIHNNENPEICSKCAARCCEKYAGIFKPTDIVPFTVGHIINKLIAGEWTVDDCGEFRFIRPRHLGEPKIYHRSWGGVCVYSTKTGCKLSFEDRPFQCRALIPSTGRTCKFITGVSSSKYVAAKWWRDHQELIIKAQEKAGAYISAYASSPKEKET